MGKELLELCVKSLEPRQVAHHFYLDSCAGGAMCRDVKHAFLSPDYRCHNEILSLKLTIIYLLQSK